MTIVTELFLVLTENLVLTYAFGIPSLLSANGSRRKMLQISALSAVFILIGCTLLSLLRPLLPAGEGTLYLPLCSAVLNGILDVLLLLLFAALFGTKAHRIIPQLHAAAFSSAVLGAVLLDYAQNLSVRASAAFGLRCGAGYLLAALMLCCAAPVLYSEKMPAAVRGWRGMLLYTALLSMAAACIGSPTV